MSACWIFVLEFYLKKKLRLVGLVVGSLSLVFPTWEAPLFRSVAATRDLRPNLICFNAIFDPFPKTISKQFVGVTIVLANIA